MYFCGKCLCFLICCLGSVQFSPVAQSCPTLSNSMNHSTPGLPVHLQHHSSKVSIFWCSVFFMVQLSNPYMTTGKTIALTIQTFVSKVMSLLFHTLSRFVIAFPPRSKCRLILWLQSPSAVILEPKKIKFVITSTFSPSLMRLDAKILDF